MVRNRKRYKIYLSLILFFLGFSSIFSYGLAINNHIPALSYQGMINPNEEFSFSFLHNLNFSIRANVDVNLSIDYHSLIFNRESSIEVNNSNSISLNITVKFQPSQFFSNLPKDPTLNDTKLILRYYTVYRYIANSSVEKITFKFKKLPIAGLTAKKNYIIAVYSPNQISWQPLLTEDITDNSTSMSYLQASITNLEGDTPYFISIYEVNTVVNVPSYDWLWPIIILAFAILVTILIVISKEEYINYIKRKITPIDKGFHRLSLQDVLDNENRDKIIDIILEFPGIHFNQLLRKTNLSPGNLVWHLDILEKYKIIKKENFERYIVYFPYFQNNPISNLDLKLQKSELTLKVLQMIKEEPGIWNNLITKKMKINRKTIEYHIKKLIDLGFIYSKQSGTKKKLFLKKGSDYYNNIDEK